MFETPTQTFNNADGCAGDCGSLGWGWLLIAAIPLAPVIGFYVLVLIGNLTAREGR